MPASFIWAWDSVTGAWVKLLVDAAGHLQADVLSSALPSGAATSAAQATELTELQAKLETGDLSIEAGTKYLNTIVTNDPVISQTDPSLLKHTPHGQKTGTTTLTPFETDANGRLLITLSNLAKLDDIDDVDVPSPTDGYVLYWDAAASKWQVKAVYADPLTTLGDLLRRGAAATERLAIGSTDQVLTVVAGQPAWAAAAAGGISNVKVGHTTRNAAGAQAIIGVGFTPKVVIILATAASGGTYRAYSLGFSDGTNNRDFRAMYNTLNLDIQSNLVDVVILEGRLWTSLTSFDADGFTLTWDIYGAITVSFAYYCLR